MAIIDKLITFAENGDFATEPGTSNVGDVVDLGTASRDISVGEPLYLHIYVRTAGDGGATATGTTSFQLVSDSVSTPDTGGTQTVHITTPAVLGTTLIAGTVLSYQLPTHKVYERFLGIQVTQAVEGEDDLVCDALISPFNNVTWDSYPDAQN